MRSKKTIVTTALFGFIGLVGFTPAVLAASNHEVAGMRRLTEDEYRNSIADIFGPTINVAGSFEPSTRIGGLLEASSSILSISPAGFASLSEMGDNVAQQVVNEKNRAKLVMCTPKSPDAPDDACASQVLDHYGSLLFRRPLTKDELRAKVNLAATTAKSSKNFYTGLRYGLASLMDEPDFLFRMKNADSTNGKDYTLDNYSRATQLSYFLWDTTPDAELLRAAQTGELATADGVAKQTDRMLASPRLETGMRAFFTDMLELTGASSLPGADFDTKDAIIYPQWDPEIAASAKEETLRTVIDLTLTQNEDLRDLMTTRKTFIDRPLASVYGVPFQFGGEWMPYEFSLDAGRSGLITEVSMLRSSHPGRSSPTERGVMVMDILLCQPTPTPPANVDFSVVNNTNGPLKTVRQRLTAHATNEACASCHTHSDPIGLTLENFESTGEYRATENGEKIDVTGTLNGKKFDGAVGLGQVLRDDPKFPACVARKLYAYGVGADAYDDVDPAVYKAAYQTFVNSGYHLKTLLKAIVTSPEFFSVPSSAAEASLGGQETATK